MADRLHEAFVLRAHGLGPLPFRGKEPAFGKARSSTIGTGASPIQNSVSSLPIAPAISACSPATGISASMLMATKAGRPLGPNLAKTKILAKYNTINQVDRLHGGTKPVHPVRE
jgi:hypothetical protein